jgi:hypothetical protein
MRGADPIESFRHQLENPFLGPNYHLPIRNLHASMPFLLSELLSTTKRLRLSIGNEEEVLRGDQGMETKKRILAARNRLLHRMKKLSSFNSSTKSAKYCPLHIVDFHFKWPIGITNVSDKSSRNALSR